MDTTAGLSKAARHAIAGTTAVGHLIFIAISSQSPSEGSWRWFPAFVVDFPFSVMWLLLLQGLVPPLIFFGIAGSAWWYALAYGFTWLFRRKPHMENTNG